MLLFIPCDTGLAWHVQAIMKQMLKPFKPAQPRFEGLNTQVSQDTGAVILTDAAAYLECTVKDRLEVGPLLSHRTCC